MLAARGVSLGLGKINFSELNQMPIPDRAMLNRFERQKKKEKKEQKKIIVRKHVDKQTLWAACRAVVIGLFVIILGLAMTIVGYFDRDITTTFIRNATLGTTISIVDNSLRYKLKSMQYIGPIFMGIGMFLLIIACVITLESRDRHAQIIQDKSEELKSKRCQTIQSITGADISVGLMATSIHDDNTLNDLESNHYTDREKFDSYFNNHMESQKKKNFEPQLEDLNFSNKLNQPTEKVLIARAKSLVELSTLNNQYVGVSAAFKRRNSNIIKTNNSKPLLTKINQLSSFSSIVSLSSVCFF